MVAEFRNFDTAQTKNLINKHAHFGKYVNDVMFSNNCIIF